MESFHGEYRNGFFIYFVYDSMAYLSSKENIQVLMNLFLSIKDVELVFPMDLQKYQRFMIGFKRKSTRIIDKKNSNAILFGSAT